MGHLPNFPYGEHLAEPSAWSGQSARIDSSAQERTWARIECTTLRVCGAAKISLMFVFEFALGVKWDRVVQRLHNQGVEVDAVG